MRGGHGSGKFFINEVGRIEHEHQSRLPQTQYTENEIKAGYKGLVEKYGFYGTLLYMESKTPYKREEIITWEVSKFHYNVRYYADVAKVERNHEEIIKSK